MTQPDQSQRPGSGSEAPPHLASLDDAKTALSPSISPDESVTTPPEVEDLQSQRFSSYSDDPPKLTIEQNDEPEVAEDERDADPSDVAVTVSEVRTEPETDERDADLTDVADTVSEVRTEPETDERDADLTDAATTASEIDTETDADAATVASEVETEPEDDVATTASEVDTEPEDDVVAMASEIDTETDADAATMASEVDTEPEPDTVSDHASDFEPPELDGVTGLLPGETSLYTAPTHNDGGSEVVLTDRRVVLRGAPDSKVLFASMQLDEIDSVSISRARLSRRSLTWGLIGIAAAVGMWQALDGVGNIRLVIAAIVVLASAVLVADYALRPPDLEVSIRAKSGKVLTIDFAQNRAQVADQFAARIIAMLERYRVGSDQ